MADLTIAIGYPKDGATNQVSNYPCQVEFTITEPNNVKYFICHSEDISLICEEQADYFEIYITSKNVYRFNQKDTFNSTVKATAKDMYNEVRNRIFIF